MSKDDADQAQEVPFVEQLRSIPKDYRTCRAIQWSDDGRETGHQFIPVGYMMHRAADEIESLRSSHSEHVPSGGEPVAWAIEADIVTGVRAFTSFHAEEANALKMLNARQARYAGANRKLVPLYALPSSQPEAAVAKVLEAAQSLAEYVRPNRMKHITEVNLIEAIDAMRASPQPEASGELEALRMDAERLDWLEQLVIPSEEINDLIRNWRVNGKRYPGGLRDAIDAALRASGGKEGG